MFVGVFRGICGSECKQIIAFFCFSFIDTWIDKISIIIINRYKQMTLKSGAGSFFYLYGQWPLSLIPHNLEVCSEEFLILLTYLDTYLGCFTTLMFAQATPDLHSPCPSQSPAIFQLSATTICKQKGNVIETGRGGGSHGVHRPFRTCQLFHAKIVCLWKDSHSLVKGCTNLLFDSVRACAVLEPFLDWAEVTWTGFHA